MQNYIETAKDCVGYTTLKDFQVAAVEACLSGNDVFLSQQTGMGKSAIYELFPFAKDQQLIQDGKLQGPLNARKPFSSVLIISPLIALMEDQVTSLSNRGLAAVQLSTEGSVMKDILNGKYTYIFSSPETILQKGRSILRNNTLKQQLQAMFIDESHCIAKWWA